MKSLAELKEKNPLWEVIQETGEPLRFDPETGLYHGEGGLTVNPQKGRYYLGGESGDVFSWLIRRFGGWKFKDAARYLEQRLKLSQAKREALFGQAEALQAPGGAGQVETTGKAQELSGPRDWRRSKAAHLLIDYPNLDEVMSCSNAVKLAIDTAWIPVQFQNLVGEIDSQSCDFCGREFDGWQETGRAFLAVELGSNYEILPDRQGAGVYCAECVSRFRRWRKGLDYLGTYLRRAGSLAQVDQVTSVMS